MSKSWPVKEFNEYLYALMEAKRIRSHAELSRITDVSQNQFSNWRRGLAQPRRETLKRIAPALGLVSPAPLYIAAGLDTEEDLGIQQRVDLSVLPQAIQDLGEVYAELRAVGQEEAALTAVQMLIGGLRDHLRKTVEQPQPSGRAKRAS